MPKQITRNAKMHQVTKVTIKKSIIATITNQTKAKRAVIGRLKNIKERLMWIIIAPPDATGGFVFL